jgi:uncharacterized protein YcnI
LALLIAGAALATPAAASAHIQVTPAVVAPDDPVKFTVTVPGESDAETTKVDLKMPANLLPFSYAETPGWKRKLVMASNGAVDRVIWTGRIPKDGFVEFAFLAGTPEKPGTLDFKALQTYSDGKIVRWIGSTDSENPAPVVKVEQGAPRQNAGGEGAKGAGDAPAAASATAAPTEAASPPTTADDGERDTLAIGLGGAGLVLGIVALAVSLRRHRTPAA